MDHTKHGELADSINDDNYLPAAIHGERVEAPSVIDSTKPMLDSLPTLFVIIALLVLALALTGCSEVRSETAIATKPGAWIFTNNCLQTATRDDIFVCPDGNQYKVAQ